MTTITQELLALAARAAGIDAAWRGDDLCPVPRRTKTKVFADIDAPWQPHEDHGQLHDLAMACKIRIDPIQNEIATFGGSDCVFSYTPVDCQDFPALANAVILAAAGQQLVKEKQG